MDYEFNIDYRQRIIDMVSQIKAEQFLKMIYGFVSVCYRQEAQDERRMQIQRGYPHH